MTAVTAGGVPAHWLTSPAGLWVSEVRLSHLPPLQVPLRVCAFNRDRATPGRYKLRARVAAIGMLCLCWTPFSLPQRLASMTRSASTACATQTSEASLWQCRGALERGPRLARKRAGPMMVKDNTHDW